MRNQNIFDKIYDVKQFFNFFLSVFFVYMIDKKVVFKLDSNFSKLEKTKIYFSSQLNDNYWLFWLSFYSKY